MWVQVHKKLGQVQHMGQGQEHKEQGLGHDKELELVQVHGKEQEKEHRKQAQHMGLRQHSPPLRQEMNEMLFFNK